MRRNSVGIPMIAEHMRQKLFPNTEGTPSRVARHRAKRLLEEFDLDGDLDVQITPNEVDLPDIEGANMLEHFNIMAEELSKPYLGMAEALARMEVPEMPTRWRKQAGWTRYVPGQRAEAVAHPIEPYNVFDVEVLVKSGNYPVMAVCVTNAAWYGWVSPFLCRGTKDNLIPFGKGKQLIVGWNCSYDRARVEEEYNFEPSGLRFWDAMSMHIATAGLSGKQRNHFTALKKHIDDDNYGGHIPKWAYETTTNSLKAAAEFYLGDEVDKEIRNLFVDGTVQDIHNNFQELMCYNAQDVLTTLKIYQILWFKFRRTCPSDVTFAGMLTMGKPFLPVGDRWKHYIPRCQAAYNKAKRSMDSKLESLADKVISTYGENGNLDPNDCPWIRNLDWVMPGTRSKKLRDKPQWFRKATDLGKKKITSRNSVVPYLLRMSWLGYPLYCDKKMKWGYLVPIGSDYTTNTKAFKVEDYPEHLFYKIPHKNGEDSNCGNPLAKDYLDSMESGVLTAQDPDAQEILELAISISYWVSVQNRVYQQFCHYAESDGEQKYGMILPQVLVSGTVTRRAVEPTWLTASNPKKTRIGSEIKTVVKMPEGYIRLGADVDS